ncbi:hypothetical protein AN219_35835 [Streptomyces nanshensis]|nr:hypothetical protein AN219_35835 [Streptomyces nanshensis]
MSSLWGTGEPSRFWWRIHDRDAPDPLADGGGWWRIGEEGFQEPEERFGGYNAWLNGTAPAWSDDLLRVARAVFLADKLVRRDLAFDSWTRQMLVSVPVSEPAIWESATYSLLRPLLQTLTADEWDLRFRELEPGYVQEPFAAPWEPAQEVSLFSGGLDSLSWAARRAAVSDGPLALVTFGEGSLKPLQQRAHQAVQRVSRKHHNRELRPIWRNRNPNGKDEIDGKDGRVVESSSRPRGLLYASTAVRIAAAEGVGTVNVPENGLLALNPPLSPARPAALSTRSVHPRTLYLLNQLIGTIGGAVRVENPLQSCAKGAACAEARRVGLSAAELEDSVSCGGPPTRLRGAPYNNCGTCYPCLIRRASLLHANEYDGTDYEAEPWHADQSTDRTRHWNALQRWLDGPFTTLDLYADLPLPPGADARRLVEVVESGREELRALVRSGLDAGRAGRTSN